MTVKVQFIVFTLDTFVLNKRGRTGGGGSTASPTCLNQHTVDTLLKANSSTYGRHNKTPLNAHTNAVFLHSRKQTIPLGGRRHFQGLKK